MSVAFETSIDESPKCFELSRAQGYNKDNINKIFSLSNQNITRNNGFKFEKIQASYDRGAYE